MFMKKRQYAQVLAKAHGLLEHIEKTDSESGYSSDHDSDGERELVIAEVEEEAAPSNVEAHFSFKFSSDNELVMEEVPVNKLNEKKEEKNKRESVIKHTGKPVVAPISWKLIQSDDSETSIEMEEDFHIPNPYYEMNSNISSFQNHGGSSLNDAVSCACLQNKVPGMNHSLVITSNASNQLLINFLPQQGGDQNSSGKKAARSKEFCCNYQGCKKSYYKQSHLKAHVRSHTGEKPFLCPYPNCEKVFTRSDELSRHKRAHAGVKKFVCKFCGKAFMRSDHLSKHENRHLTGPKLSNAKGCFKISRVPGSSGILVDLI